jgi:OmpA-OmpF porin, OOP family
MRSFKALVAAGALVVAVPSLAHAQWYAGADVGASTTEDASVSAGTGNGTTYNWGPVGLVEAGYSFGAPKVELELGYRSNDVGNVGGTSGGSSASSLSLMTNAIYDFGGMVGNGAWHPFLGAGIGAAKLTANDVTKGGAWSYSGNDWQFAYQGIAGVGYDVSANWMAKLQYRYFATADYAVTAANGSTGSAEYKNHAVLVGLTYKFGAPAAAEPAPAPMPVAAPAPVPVPPKVAMQKNYIVFFDFDKAAITPEADRTIRQAAGAAKMGGVTRLNLTGHTDMAGSDKYNMALSLKRANVVKDALVQQGIPAAEIVVVGKGKADPLVATKDGMREPQNRRVEIVLQ